MRPLPRNPGARALALALTLALALAPACAQDKPLRVSTTQSKDLGSDVACAVGDGQLPPLPEDPAPIPAVRPVFQNQPLLPPRPGESASDLTGCLASGERTEGTGTRYPPQGRFAVRLNPLSGGVIVTHELDHACCLEARVSSTVEGAQVRVVETLSGTPCRCQCASTLRTAVGLAPGTYTVSVVLQDPEGRQSVAHTGQVTVAP